VPKQVYKVEQFHGGLNNQADPRDIEDSQLSVATDVCVDEVGRIRPLGGIASHSTANSPSSGASVITAGYGLFTFGHDKDAGQAGGGGSGADIPCEYLLLQDGSSQADIAIYNGGTDGDASTGSGADTWGQAKIDLGSSASAKAVFYSADGAVRVADGNHGNSAPQWYGYIDKLLYDTVPAHSLTIEAGGSSYSASDNPTLKNDASETNWLNGQADVVSVSGGSITAITVTFSGGGYANANSMKVFAGSGSGAVITGDSNNYLASINGWYAVDGEIKKPSYGLIGTTAPASSANGWNLNITTPADSSSTWIAETYQIGFSLIYDGNQESLLYIPTSSHTFAVAAGDMLRMSAYMESLANSSGLSKRVTGGRAYFKILDSNDDWRLLCDMDVYKGLRATLDSDDWSPWGEYAANDLRTCDSTTATDLFRVCESITMNSDTYRSINGYGPDEISISNKSYACSTVVGRTVYIGNVKRIDTFGNTVIQGDAMYKSIPGKFDVFPNSNKIEVNVRDGEDIVALESFADRILQFKKRTLYVVNVGGAFEFLEDKHTHKGVTHPAAVCKTDFGIAWANNLGCYLYDGRSVKNLLEKNGQKVIDDSTWQSFFTNNGMVGYLPKKRQIVVVKDCTASNVGDCFLYDMVTRSWVKGDSKFNDSILKTNFIIDWNNDLVYAYDNSGTPVLAKWDPDADSTGTFAFSTKDIDFGFPAVRKKIYRARVSYKGDGTGVNLQYSVNGDNNTVNPFYRTTADGSTDNANSDTTPLLDVGTDDWVLAELKPVTSADANNVYSFQLVFTGTPAADFEINDISIVYRAKSIK
jgi:hypothetical protein